jgi:putative transposase
VALAEAGAKIAPSTYHARHARPPSVRAVVEQELKAEIVRVHEANLGARKVRGQLDRGGIPVARRRMERLMRQLGVPARSAASPTAPPCWPRSPPAPATWSTATSLLLRRNRL